MENKPSLIQIFSTFITGLLGIVLLAMLRAWAIGTLWFWYVVPTFDMRALTIASAFGIGLLVRFITTDIKLDSSTDDKEKDNPEKKVFLGIIAQIATTLFIIFLGWLGTFFM